MTDCLHAPSDNPRYETTCRKCGRIMPDTPNRDVELEVRMLRMGIELANRAYSAADTVFERAALERFTKGAAEYGEFGFLESDNLSEALEEPVDAACWSILELERLAKVLDDNAFSEASQSVAAIVAAAINTRMFIRRFQSLLAELKDEAPTPNT
jgi:hypothetical protein